MKRFRQWSIFPALLVLLVAFAGCEGESPTEPPRPGGSGGNGGTPPTDAAIALAVSNATPLVGSTTSITATVTQGGQPVPNGTAVEFSTNLGAFFDSNTNTSIRTTTNGVASVILSSTAPGTATVNVRVNNANATATVVFVSQPTDPQEPDTAPSITSITPSVGAPDGNVVVTITGKNFDAPLRVLFGDQVASILFSSTSEIRVSAPRIDLGVGEQAREVPITVITRAGTEDEAQATGPLFRYELEILTPEVYDVSPSNGPNEGNTRITIVGEGFQSPAKVFFGTFSSEGLPLADEVEAEVQKVGFGQIIAIAPPATGLGATLANAQVSIRVKNVNSNTQTIEQLAFRYGPTIQITNVSPTQVPATESTRVTIDGWGFDDPVAVTIGGIAVPESNIISVVGTKIVLQSPIPDIEGCSDQSGEISVTNIEEGITATAEGINFTFDSPRAAIVGVSPNPAPAGGVVTIRVDNAGLGAVRFQIGDTTVLPTVQTENPDGTTSYGIVIPSNLTFDTADCVVLGVAGEQFINTAFSITFENNDTGCTDTLDNGLVVIPPDTSCRVPPAEATVEPASAEFDDQAVGTPSSPETIFVTNEGGSPLTVTNIVESGDGEGNFAVSGDTCTGQVLNPGGQCTFNITFTPATAGDKAASYSVQTTANNPLVSASGTGI